MDISVFLTQQTAQGGKAPTGQVLQGGTGIFATGAAGLTFMDLIFARLTADVQNGENGQHQTQAKADIITKSASPTAGYQNHAEPVTTRQILQALFDGNTEALEKLATPEELAALKSAFTIDSNTGDKILDKGASQIIADKKTLNAFLESLLIGVPQESRLALVKITPDKAQKMLDEMEKSGEADPAIIATGLNPEQLTQLLKDIADGNEQGDVFGVASLIKLAPTTVKKEVVFLPRGVVTTQPKRPSGDTAPQQTANSGQESKLNALTVSDDNANTGELEESDFEGVLRILERAQGKGQKTGQQADGFNKGIENAINKIREHISAGLSTVQGAPPALTEIFTNFAVDSIFPDGWDFATGSSHSLNVTGPAQLTSMVSHIQQAGLPHPATQMVASVIARATTNGETRNISIQLDPPDLGRVKISLEFNKENNTVKAVLMAEKPETHMMLQRDAQVLERALQEAGLDTDNSSLEFQLSQDGNMFEQDEHSTGGNSGGSNDSAEGDEDGVMEIMETTMDWYIDPETGAMRYDMLV